MNLYSFENQIIGENIFLDVLSNHVKPNNKIYIEADLMKFGKILCYNRKIFFNSFLNIFKQITQENGNISMPSFSYSFGSNNKKKIFSKEDTVTPLSSFNEFFRLQKDAHRSNDPMYSVTSIGALSKELTSISNNSFGKNSFYENFHKVNGKLITFGLGKFDPTFVHYIENYFDTHYEKIEYRFNKKFEGHIIDGGKKIKRIFYSFVRNVDKFPNIKFSDKNLFLDLKKKSMIDIIKIGNSEIYISDSNSVFEIAINGMLKNKFYLTNYIS